MLRVLAAASLLLCACGGSGSTPAAPAPQASSPTPTATRAAGGLVGTIDLARVRAVCENARQADPLVQTGMGMAEADRALRSAADLLVRPPVDAAALALGRAVRRDVAAHRESEAIASVAAFCRARGG